MRAAFALVLAAIASAEAPNKSRRLQAGDCADLDGDGVVNVNGARAALPFCVLARRSGGIGGGGGVEHAVHNADARPDLLLLLAAYGADASGDVDGDGATNVNDLLLLLAGVRTPLLSSRHSPEI